MARPRHEANAGSAVAREELPAGLAEAKQCPVQDSYIKSVIQGLIVSGLVLSIAGGAGLALFVIIAVTQAGWLIAVVPVVFIAFFTLITMVLLKRDALARKRGESPAA